MKILFICTHNRCRSILAEAITRHCAAIHRQNSLDSNVELQAFSAGSQPAGEVHPLTLRYLSESGISTEDLVSQSWNEFKDNPPDIVITVCDSAAGEACPLWMGDCAVVHWGLPDPSRVESDEHAIAAAFRQVMDTLMSRIQAVIKLLDNGLTKEQLLGELKKLGNK